MRSSRSRRRGSPRKRRRPDPDASRRASERREERKYCHCTTTCGKLLSLRSRRRHYAKVKYALTGGSESESSSFSDLSDPMDPNIDDNAAVLPPSNYDGTAESYAQDSFAMDVDTDSSASHEDSSDTDSSIPDIESDYESDTEPFGAAFGMDLEEWKSFDEDGDHDVPLTRDEMIAELEEMLGPDEEGKLWERRNEILSDQDHDNIRAFRLKLLCNIPHVAFAQMRHAFRHKLDISSHWVMIHRVAILSGIEPMWFHCCPDSCMAYTGDYENLIKCKYCNLPRFNASGAPRRLFCYLPIIPRLQGFFSSPAKVKQLLYRHDYHHIPGTISDVFDCEAYRSLRTQNVVVDGQQLSHKYFDGKYDIALGICTDSYLLFDRRRKGPSATPIVADLYSVPPKIRTHLEELMCCGVISGPKGPKDAHSYFVPLDAELAKLAIGVPTYNALDDNIFSLRAYNLFAMGDIIAAEKMMNIKGHNSLSGCRSCEMKGYCNKRGGETIYYMPLAAPNDDGELRKTWDPRNLPLRTDEGIQKVVDAIAKAKTPTAKERIAKYDGIKGLPVLRRVGSLDRARSYPWEIMHLFFENNIPNLVLFWSGKYKGLDTGSEDYEISEEVWAEIWAETVEAMKDIPSDFCRSLAGGPGKFTAEAWCFWFVYMAPGLLKGRFSNPKYHVHACELGDIIKTCLLFTITTAEIDVLEEKIVGWVQTYERYSLRSDPS